MGSEMCIRDSSRPGPLAGADGQRHGHHRQGTAPRRTPCGHVGAHGTGRTHAGQHPRSVLTVLADLSVEAFSVLAVGSFVAGLIDAIVGGGGLVLIPLILIVAPATPEASAMATNKLAAVFGTSSAATRMLRSSDIRQKIDRRLVAYGVPLAFACSASGALLVAALSSEVLRPLVIVLLLAVGTYVALKPSFGTPQRAPSQSLSLIHI